MDYLLDELLLIEKHPGSVLGGKEITRLLQFIFGYRACLRNFVDTPSAFDGFNEFVEQKYKKRNAMGWYGLIRNDAEGNENVAFDKFYVLLHEYLDSAS